MRFLVNRDTGKARTWTEPYGDNMRVVDEHEVRELNGWIQTREHLVHLADPSSVDEDVPPPPVVTFNDPDEVIASDAAINLAAARGINLEGIQGSGREGTITVADVRSALSEADETLLDTL